jgi:hypothetical protein
MSTQERGRGARGKFRYCNGSPLADAQRNPSLTVAFADVTQELQSLPIPSVELP